MDIEGPMSKAFAWFFVLAFGVLFLLAFIGLVILTRGILLVVVLVFLSIFGFFFIKDNRKEIFKKFKRGGEDE